MIQLKQLKTFEMNLPEEYKKLIALGIDRIVLSVKALNDINKLKFFFHNFGLETFIIHLPLIHLNNGHPPTLHSQRIFIEEVEISLRKLKEDGLFPEILITDVVNTGFGNKHSEYFWTNIPVFIQTWPRKSAYGGLYSLSVHGPDVHQIIVEQFDAMFIGSALFQGTGRMQEIRSRNTILYRSQINSEIHEI